MTRPSSRSVVAGLLVGVAALAVSVPGVHLRDLTGDELGTLGKTVAEMIDRSVESDRPDHFSAHLPLAWLLRHAVQTVFGVDAVWHWRLHTVVGHVAGALATWAVVRRLRDEWAGVLAGAFVALAPVAAYHARDSTNYVFDPLVGALLLGGVGVLATGRPAALLLGTGVLFGVLNEWYFVFVAPTVLLATCAAVRVAPDRALARRAAFQAWAPGALLGTGVVVALFVRGRATSVDALVARHANEATEWSSWKALDSAYWWFVSLLDGYEVFTRPTPDLGWIFAVVAVAALLRALVRGDVAARTSVAVVLVMLAVVVVVQASFVPWLGREFPAGPRQYLLLLPFVALLLADLAAALPRRLRPLAAAALLLIPALASVRQAANVTSGRAWAATVLEEEWQSGDRVLSTVPMRFRLEGERLAATSNDWCLPDDAERIWLVTFPGGPTFIDSLVCVTSDASIWRLVWWGDKEVAPHENPLTNSYLTSMRLMRFERGGVSVADPPGHIEPVARWGDDPRFLRVRRAAAWALLVLPLGLRVGRRPTPTAP